MRKKIIGILICMLLLVSVTLPAMGMKTHDDSTVNNLISDDKNTFYSDDVPIWKKGTVWTYKLDDINIDFDNGYGEVFHLHIGTGNIPFTVVSDSGSSYLVSFNAKISGNMYIETETGHYSIKVQATLIRTQLKGDISFRKSDLAISSINIQLSAKVALSISKPISLPALRVFATLKLNIGFSNPYTILSFPMATNSSWGLPATGLSVDGSLRSPWLRVVNIANTLLRLTGRIPAEYKDLSDMIAKILPVIDISDTLNLFNISNPIDIPEEPGMFYCSNMENVSVQAGSYNAYNISIMGMANMYYAPDVGKIIKITGNIKDFIPYIENISMELVKVGKSEYPVCN
jgi:hypothetical protein